MVRLSRQVRRILDDAGLPEVKIFASSGFDEYLIARRHFQGGRHRRLRCRHQNGRFGRCALPGYCLQTRPFGDREIRKLSTGKVTLAGRKQVFRKTDKGGRCLEDVIGLREEAVPGAAPLLEPVMADGRLVDAATRPCLLAVAVQREPGSLCRSACGPGRRHCLSGADQRSPGGAAGQPEGRLIGSGSGSGYWVLGTGYWVLGTGCWVLGAGYWVLGTGFCGYWVLGILGSGFLGLIKP